MLSFLPEKIAVRAIILYIAALITVSLVFFKYAMQYTYILLGLIEVVAFFLCSSHFSRAWGRKSNKDFALSLFVTALVMRVVWVVFSYFLYISLTGVPFEPEAGDSIGYHQMGLWLYKLPIKQVWFYLFTNTGTYSDSGYNLYLTFIYKIIGPRIFLARLVKAMLSAVTCNLLYKFAARSMGEKVGRLAGIFCAFMPNLIIYCGLHLKETEMLFLAVAFLERTDYLLRTRKYKVSTIVIPLSLAISLFLFRTVLGVVGVFAFITSMLFTGGDVVGHRKRVFVIVWAVLALSVLAGGTIANEVEGIFEERTENQATKRMAQTNKGNQWAKYATGSVMAPMMFIMPFPTMVDVDNQYNQQIINGGNYVRNFMGFFVLLALFRVIFRTRKWRDFSLIGSYTIAYLGILALSGFANSERFLLPALPGLIIMWAYGLEQLDRESYRYFSYWQAIVLVMPIAWAFFKLGSRGIF